MFYKPENDEQQEINDAIETHMDALKFEHMVFRTSIALYFAGFLLFVLGSGMVEGIGLALLMTGSLAFLMHFFFHLDTEKKRKKAAEIINPYLKRQTQALYQELREKFSDDPSIRFIHNDDGSITVQQKRKDGGNTQ